MRRERYTADLVADEKFKYYARIHRRKFCIIESFYAENNERII